MKAEAAMPAIVQREERMESTLFMSPGGGGGALEQPLRQHKEVDPR